MNYELNKPITWLSVTPYLRDWLENEFGGDVKIYGRPVLTVHYLPESKEIFRMETQEDTLSAEPIKGSMSAMRMDCLQAGCQIYQQSVEKLYNITKQQLQMFVPIECPKMAMTKYGVLRPWDRNILFGQQQTFAMQKLLRSTFWQAVAEFDNSITENDGGNPHTAISMTEAFCAKNNIPDLYAEELRREWQRQVKSSKKI